MTVNTVDEHDSPAYPEPPDGAAVVVKYPHGVLVAWWRDDNMATKDWALRVRDSEAARWFTTEYADKWSDPWTWQVAVSGAVAVYHVGERMKEGTDHA